MIRDHFKNTDIRKAELDPSTFANDDEALIAWAEELQTQPESRDYRWLLAMPFIGLVCWGVVAWVGMMIWEMI